MLPKPLLITICGLVITAAAAFATSPAKNHIGSLPVLLGVESVRQELHLTSLQRALLDSLRSDYKAEARKVVNSVPQTASDRLAAEEKLEKITDEYNNRALSVLNPTQRVRFLQIEHQVIGPTHLYSPSIQKQLGLNSLQISQIEKIRQKGLKYVAHINKKFEEGKIGYIERIKLLHARRLSDGTKALKLLTPQQREAFLAMGGKKFKI